MKRLLQIYLKNYSGFPVVIWILAGAVFINSAGAAASTFLSLYLVYKLHFRVMEVGFVMASFGGGAIIGSYVSGILCDKYSALKISIFSLFVNSVALFTLFYLSHLYAFIFTSALMGASYAAFSPANRVTFLSYCGEDDKARANSLRYMMVNLGISGGLFFGGIIADISYHWVFIFNGAATFTAAVILLVFCRMQSQDLSINLTTKNPNQTMLNDPVMLLYFLGLFCCYLIFSQLRTTYPIYLHGHYALSMTRFSYLFLLNTLVIVSCQVPILNFTRKFNQVFSCGLGVCLIGVGLSLLPLGSSYVWAILICLIWTLGEILFFSTLQTLIYERADPAVRGKSMGIYQSVYAIGNMLGPLAGSWLYDFASGDALWLACGVIGIGLFGIFMLINSILQAEQSVVIST